MGSPAAVLHQTLSSSPDEMAGRAGTRLAAATHGVACGLLAVLVGLVWQLWIVDHPLVAVGCQWLGASWLVNALLPPTAHD